MSEKFKHALEKEPSFRATPPALPETCDKVDPLTEHDKPMCDFTYSSELDHILNKTFRGRRQLFNMDV